MPVEAMMRIEFRQSRLRISKFFLLPRAAWEKVPEGRMRALCSSSISTSGSFYRKNHLCLSAGRKEEPSPGLRPPSPIASQRERGKPFEFQPIASIFPGQPRTREKVADRSDEGVGQSITSADWRQKKRNLAGIDRAKSGGFGFLRTFESSEPG